MQDERDDREQESIFSKWLNATAIGRKVLAAKYWLDDKYFEHTNRYDSMNEEAYRNWCRVVAGLVLLILLGGGFWLGRSVYHHLAEKHDEAQTQLFMSRGEYHSALLSAHQTLSINPSNLVACQVMSQIADQAGSPLALEWLQRVAALQPTLDNKLMLAASALRYQPPPFPLTASILTEVAASCSNRASYQMLAARLALGNHDLADAKIHFQKAIELDPTNQLYVLNLATLQLVMSDEAAKKEAREALSKLLTDPQFKIAALRPLVIDRLENQDLSAAKRYSDELIASPQATVGDQLENLKILQRLKSSEFDTRLAAVQDLTATNAPGVEQLSGWMQANGLLAENILWLTNLPDEMQRKQPVQLALAQAYMQNNDWPMLRTVVTSGNWGNLEYLRLALVAHANAKLGMMDVAALSWDSAVTESGGRLAAYKKLLELAESWGLKGEQTDLLKDIVDKYPKEIWARQRLAKEYFATGNTLGMYELFVRQHHYVPDDLNCLNNLAATALILKTNLPQAFKWAEGAYTNAPDSPFEATTYAYALHLQQRNAEGLAVLKKLPDGQLKDPSVALYYGLLLADDGKGEEAVPYLQTAKTKGELWPEERQLLNAALQKIQGRKH